MKAVVRECRRSAAEAREWVPKMENMTGNVSSRGAETTMTRRTNNERATQTRRQVMDAVIAILHAKGFPALTNALIIKQTGISSGALMHHFPTRQDLLAATVTYAYERISTYRERQLQRLAPGLPRFRALIDLSWHVARMPASFAVNEVRIGARSDARMAAYFRPVFTRIGLEYGRAIARLARDAGLRPDESLQGLWVATSMAMRSLAIDGKTYAGDDVAGSALLALRTLRETLIAQQLGPSVRQDPRIAWKPGRQDRHG